MHPPGLEPLRHHRSHPIPRRKAAHLLLAHHVAPRESFFGPQCPTMLPSSHGLDRKGFERRYPDSCEIPNAECVIGMGLLDAEVRPVPARAPSAPGSDG